MLMKTTKNYVPFKTSRSDLNPKDEAARAKYTSLTPKLLEKIGCLPARIRDNLIMPSGRVNFPTKELAMALESINLGTFVNYGYYAPVKGEVVPENIGDAIKLLNQALDAGKKIRIGLDVATASGDETWDGAPLRLSFYREGEKPICIDLPLIPDQKNVKTVSE